MPKRKIYPEDENQAAASVMRQVVSRSRHPGAVALSKLGSSKGGKARAKKLSARRRKMIARKAAKTRWERKK